MLELYCILHKHDMDLFHMLSIDREHSNDAGEQGVWVFSIVTAECWQFAQIQIEFVLRHRFDYVFVIIRKKEKGPAAACPLTCFENHVSVEFRRQ
jgi:hypothetical protein